MHPLKKSACALLATLALVSACRDKPAAPTDSSLANDLALAQRPAVEPTTFNDAPAGATAPASRAPAVAAPRHQPQRTSAPAPRPTPRRDTPPAPVAQAPQPAPPQSVAAAPAAAPEAAAGIIGMGTRVGMTTNARVCTNNLLVGDKFGATVTSGTVGSNGAGIPAGATVVLEVASVNRADPIESSRIEFRVRAIDVNGEPLPAAGDVATLGALEKVQTSNGNDAKKVVGGAVAGAVLGRIFGHSTKATVIGAAAGAAAGTVAAKNTQNAEACLPQGSPLRLTLSRDMVFRHAGAL